MTSEESKALVRRWSEIGPFTPEGLSVETDDFRWIMAPSMEEAFFGSDDSVRGPAALARGPFPCRHPLLLRKDHGHRDQTSGRVPAAGRAPSRCRRLSEKRDPMKVSVDKAKCCGAASVCSPHRKYSTRTTPTESCSCLPALPRQSTWEAGAVASAGRHLHASRKPWTSSANSEWC
jgi:hypothetical protein